jgi:peptidoglycan/xylan/chitin deacetylase (PgdA/CDA1 family)
MFRPPYGKMTLPTFWSLRQRGAPVWWWTIDSGDTFETLPSIDRVVEMVSRRTGGIVLMHDGSIDPRPQHRNDFVLKLTEALLDMAQRDSLRIVPLRELAL